jgi:hypothetical protein
MINSLGYITKLKKTPDYNLQLRYFPLIKTKQFLKLQRF